MTRLLLAALLVEEQAEAVDTEDRCCDCTREEANEDNDVVAVSGLSSSPPLFARFRTDIPRFIDGRAEDEEEGVDDLKEEGGSAGPLDRTPLIEVAATITSSS